MAYTYILKCSDNSLYTGACVSLETRMKDHFYKTSKCAKYTRSREILSIEAVWESETVSSACKLETAIKKLRKSQKIDLIENPEKLMGRYANHLEDISYKYIPDISLNRIVKKDN